MEILYMALNQDHQCLSVGTTDGFVIYNLNPFQIRFQRRFGEGIGIVEILNKCNILALVGGGSNPKFSLNRLIIWDDYKEKAIGELECPSKILRVKLNKKYLVVSTEKSIRVYAFQNLYLLKEIQIPYGNPSGMFAFSVDESKPLLVYPSNIKGAVKVTNFVENWERELICHQNAIKCLTLNQDATKLLTCSEQGTLVKIFDMINLVKLKEVRRGSAETMIHSIEFSNDDLYVATTSNNATVHIHEMVSKPKGKSGFIKAVLPDYFGSEWGIFAIPSKVGVRKLACLIFNAPQIYFLYIFTYDGDFQMYEINFGMNQIELVTEGVI